MTTDDERSTLTAEEHRVVAEALTTRALRTREDDLAIINIPEIPADVVLTEIIGAADPVLALTSVLLKRDDGGDRGQAYARAALRVSGKSADEAEAIVTALLRSIWPE